MSFSPYLDDLRRRLLHQYLLIFLAKPFKKGGDAKRQGSHKSAQRGTSGCRSRRWAVEDNRGIHLAANIPDFVILETFEDYDVPLASGANIPLSGVTGRVP